MSLFNDILSSLQKKFQDSAGRSAEVASIISTVIGVPITPEQVTIKKGTAYIRVPPTVKLAVTLKKDRILTQCKERGISIFNLQ